MDYIETLTFDFESLNKKFCQDCDEKTVIRFGLFVFELLKLKVCPIYNIHPVEFYEIKRVAVLSSIFH